MLLTSLANVKSLLKIDSNTDDVILLAILTGVSKECESYMCRQTESKERTKYFDVRQNQQIFELDAWPVSALKAYNDYDRSFVAGTEIGASEMTFLGDDGLLIVDRFGLVEGAKVLKVVYTGGMGSSQVAMQAEYPDLEMAARLQSAFVFEKKGKLLVSSESVAGTSIAMDQRLELLPDVKRILNDYRRQEFIGH